MGSNTVALIHQYLSHHGWLRGLSLLLSMTIMGGCKATEFEAPVIVAQDAGPASAISENARVWMTVGDRRFAITLADTAAARAFMAKLPLTLDMAALNGNEKHADLPHALPTNPERPGTIHNGDLMLYGSNTVVVFYKTFRSPYAYTRLGHLDDPTGLGEALGTGNSRVMFAEHSSSLE